MCLSHWINRLSEIYVYVFHWIGCLRYVCVWPTKLVVLKIVSYWIGCVEDARMCLTELIERCSCPIELSEMHVYPLGLVVWKMSVCVPLNWSERLVIKWTCPTVCLRPTESVVWYMNSPESVVREMSTKLFVGYIWSTELVVWKICVCVPLNCLPEGCVHVAMAHWIGCLRDACMYPAELVVRKMCLWHTYFFLGCAYMSHWIVWNIWVIELIGWEMCMCPTELVVWEMRVSVPLNWLSERCVYMCPTELVVWEMRVCVPLNWLSERCVYVSYWIGCLRDVHVPLNFSSARGVHVAFWISCMRFESHRIYCVRDVCVPLNCLSEMCLCPTELVVGDICICGPLILTEFCVWEMYVSNWMCCLKHMCPTDVSPWIGCLKNV